MTKTELIPWIFAFIGAIYGGGTVIHSHAENKVVAGIKISKEYRLMSYAEVKPLDAKQSLRIASLKPKEKRSDYEAQQISDLSEAKTYWANRVRELEQKGAK